jgi:hypothetical protein
MGIVLTPKVGKFIALGEMEEKLGRVMKFATRVRATRKVEVRLHPQSIENIISEIIAMRTPI